MSDRAHPLLQRVSGFVLLALLSVAVPAAAELPQEVSAAIAAQDCPALLRLNRQYWRLVDAPDAPARARQAAAALEAQILAQPLCGRAKAELLQVRPLSGPNVFAADLPAALAPPGEAY